MTQDIDGLKYDSAKSSVFLFTRGVPFEEVDLFRRLLVKDLLCQITGCFFYYGI